MTELKRTIERERTAVEGYFQGDLGLAEIRDERDLSRCVKFVVYPLSVIIPRFRYKYRYAEDFCEVFSCQVYV